METNHMAECWQCKHKREVPGNCHIRCNNPDVSMTGNPHGVRNGWFLYPLLFDPVWKIKACENFTDVECISPSVSLASKSEQHENT